MKRTILGLMLGVILCSGCELSITHYFTDKELDDGKTCVVHIQGCEYLARDYGHSALFSHKGDCTNCRAWMQNEISNTMFKVKPVFKGSDITPIVIPEGFLGTDVVWEVTNISISSIGMEVFTATGFKQETSTNHSFLKDL